MKKLFTLIAVTIFSFGIVNGIIAQGLYVGVNAGYALKLASATDQNVNSSINTTYEAVNYSLGKGLDFGLNVGYMMNANVGAELGVSYLLGGKTTFEDNSTYGTSKVDIKGKMLRLVPAIVIATGMEKINPYAKLGLIIGIGSIKYTGHVTTSSAFKSGGPGDFVQKNKGGVAIGVMGAVGADFTLNDMLSVFAEINVEGLSYAPTKGELTEYKENGVDKLADLSVNAKKFEYVKKYSSNENNSPDVASKRLREKSPFSSVGLNVGIKIKLGGE